MAGAAPVPRSLVWATDVDTLPLDRVVERRRPTAGPGYLVVRSPGSPDHYWGTLLVFDDAPGPGDGERWEAIADDELGADPRVRHRTFAWDRSDGVLGAAVPEFVERGYALDDSIGLVAAPSAVVPHARANAEVVVRRLDPAEGADEDLWRGAVELEVAGRDDAFEEQSYRTYLEQRYADRRALFRAGLGSWYVATLPGSREVVAGCGIVVTQGRGRFQSVETAASHRRQGICSRLVVEVAHDAARTFGATRLVIVADSGYHALGLYESLGFERREHVHGVWRRPA